MPILRRLKHPKTPSFLLVCLITAYALYFAGYTINRHNTLNSYAADLSLIDQPMWNSVLGPGSFMEQTWGDRQQPRLAEHFEPILAPIALLFLLWDDVRVLLIAQSVALALGALPIFWIAKKQLSSVKCQVSSVKCQVPSASWAALTFALAYLLYPQLQAANIADFHADPFVVTPLLFAFWYATEKRWGWMWFWAIIAMATKETLPALTAMLGVYLTFDFYRSKIGRETITLKSLITNYHSSGGALRQTLRQAQEASQETSQDKSPFTNGLALIIVSAVWFLIATFLIVAPLAQQYFGTDGPIYFANRYTDGLAGLPQLLQDPARWQYLIGLLTAAGFLSLLAPEMLILGLPLLIANLLSNFPGQYSGEQHYSAPLVAVLMIAAIYGTRRLINKIPLREINGQPLKVAALIGVSLWLLAWSLSYQAMRGWTPISSRVEHYSMGPAARQLPDFIDQIPADAVVSASAAIHPHLAHRRVAYVFPTVEEADYLLVDVTDIPGVHPNDAKTKIMAMLADGWQLLQANHGLILAQKADLTLNSHTSHLPNTFFDFVRPTTWPSQPTALTFGDGRLQLLGYDIDDDPDDGVTVRFYWQSSGQLPADLHLWPLIYDDTGQLLSDPTQVPMIATVWYPPAYWQPDEIIITETLPQLMPPTFHVGIAVGPEGSFSDPDRRYPIQTLAATEKITTLDNEQVKLGQPRLHAGHWIQLATFKRQRSFLEQLPPVTTLQSLTPLNVRLGSTIHLTGFWLDQQTTQPGSTFPLLLRWVAHKTPSSDFTVFVHLVASDGALVAQSDAYPTWLTPIPTSQWPPNHPFLDRHTLSLPADLPAGLYTLQLGLYQAQTLERLPLASGADAVPLGQIRVE